MSCVPGFKKIDPATGKLVVCQFNILTGKYEFKPFLDTNFGPTPTPPPRPAPRPGSTTTPSITPTPNPNQYVLALDPRNGEITTFKQKVLNATAAFKNGNYKSELWPSVKVHGETIFKSTIEAYNKSKSIPPKGIMPTELTFTVDGISDITIGEAFVLQKGILPKKYDDFGFIITGVDQGIKNNRWYTSIRAQTFNIAPISDEEVEINKKRLTAGFY